MWTDKVRNNSGFTYIAALTIVAIMGVMLGMTGQAWKTIMQREREKELLFRGSQIKDAIENWYNPKYTVGGLPPRQRIHPLLNLEDLLTNQYSLKPMRFLPHIYSTKLDDKNSRCAPDCPKIKLEEDPMTGKPWEIIRCGTQISMNKTPIVVEAGQPIANSAHSASSSLLCQTYPNGIIGVASRSDEQPFKTDFRDTALENSAVVNAASEVKPATQKIGTGAASNSGIPSISKYSELKFIADQKNDHTKLYRAYHEGH